jgi:hypothetical protein
MFIFSNTPSISHFYQKQGQLQRTFELLKGEELNMEIHDAFDKFYEILSNLIENIGIALKFEKCIE